MLLRSFAARNGWRGTGRLRTGSGLADLPSNAATVESAGPGGIGTPPAAGVRETAPRASRAAATRNRRVRRVARVMEPPTTLKPTGYEGARGVRRHRGGTRGSRGSCFRTDTTLLRSLCGLFTMVTT